ncbi:MAG: DUF1749 domain-containing protein [Patescibacteria group bacterium]
MRATFLSTTTKDGIALTGLLFVPRRKADIALVWVYGLGSRLSSGSARHNALMRVCGQANVAYAAFENRGAGAISFFKNKKGKYVPGGKAMELFERCVLDIEAMIKGLRREGFKKIYFAGHSTGANKLAYFMEKRGCRGVQGFALVSPMSDIPGIKEQLGKNYAKALAFSRKMIVAGKGGSLLPLPLVGGQFWTARRFWSIAREGANEDTFPFYQSKRKFLWTKRVKVPVCVIIGEKDEFADRPTREILARFKKEIPGRYFSGAIVKNANHGFRGKEGEMTSAIMRWLDKAGRGRAKK